MSSSAKNYYLDQVMENQQRLEVDLKARKKAMPLAAAASVDSPAPHPLFGDAPTMAPLPQPAGVDVRVTGWWRWKTVLVPPNAYVVHTRRGRKEPLHLGLGVSFPYNPNTDSYLVVPGAMQTLLINAQCICRELQGLLVQGYVQWTIDDFATAYRRLDFSDVDDPMRVVNVQLREQAEAAIKDKVATMSISEVLSDKQIIIQELTARLRAVAEGAGDADKGLGLRIVTVQIKEAVVSSATLWDNLQRPFRAERDRVARLAALEAEREVEIREAEVSQASERESLEQEARMATLRAQQEREVSEREATESLRREERALADARKLAAEQQRSALQAAELEQERIAAESAVAARRLTEQATRERLVVEAQLALEELRATAAYKAQKQALELAELRQRVANDISAHALKAKLIEALPLIAEKLPKPTELRAVSLGDGSGAHALSALVAQLLGIVEVVRNGSEAPPALKG